MIYHLVFFRVKKGVTERQLKSFERQWRALSKDIPGLLSIEGGPNISIEPFSQGINRAYVVKFKNKKARDQYVPHPKHVKLGKEIAWPLLEDVCVADVEV
jgi:hypothetical protein